MSMKIRVVVAAMAGLLGLGLGSSVAKADPPPWAGGQAHSERHGDDRYRDDDRRDAREYRQRDYDHDHYRISTREQYYINDWYRRHGHDRRLPPGIAKKLYRGAPWPPPYAYAPLPVEVVRGLQPLPPGYRYYQVGADVVIANLAGQVVTDVVYGLLNR